MSDSKLGWGIIGPGNIARRFAAHLPASTTANLVAVASRDLERAERFSADFGAQRSYGDYAALLADPEVQAVYVATPHQLHLQWTLAAAAAGKHVLCEKPLSLNHAGGMLLVEAARAHDVFLMEAYMYRCHPRTAKLVELIGSGAIGTVRQIEASFGFAAGFDPGSRLFDPESGGGGILDVGGYPVSLARLVAGAALGAPFADPVEVTAVGQLGQSGVDEWTTATLRFAEGINAHVTTGVRLAAPNTVRIIGSGGYLEIDDPWLPDPEAPAEITLHRVGAEPERVSSPATYQYAAELDTVAAHLADRQAPAMSWADSLGNLATLDRWRAAIGLSYPPEHRTALPATGFHSGASGPAMPYGEVPGVDKRISRLVMGVDNQPHTQHAAIMFDDFLERGGNAFDTAYIYAGGQLERMLGQWVADRGVREDVVIIGKGAHTPHCDPASLRSQLLESLDRLQTDYVDLYFMHRDNPQVPVGEFVDVLDELHRAGKVRAFGGSNWSLERFSAANDYAATHDRQGFAALSNHLSLAEAYDVPWAGCVHVSDRASREWLAQHQVPLFPWSSQARGFFTGRAAPEDRSDAELVRCYYSEDNFERLRRARQLATELDTAPTAVALAWVLHQPFPTFPLFGPRTLAETRTSVPGLALTLTPEQVSWLDLSDRS